MPPLRRALLVLLLAASCHAQVFRYGRFEQTFTSSREYADPLRDAELTVEFSGPDGNREQVPAFWAGGRRWKVRFSPRLEGEWSYRTNCSDASNAGLHLQSGKFKARPYWGRNELYRRGGPRLSANRHYLVHADGKPWFWLADTAWNGALKSTREEWERYLADRAARKFTAVQFVMTQWRAGRADEAGQVAFTGKQKIAINPAFFERMDQKFDAVNDHGLVALPVLLWALTSPEEESPGVSLPAGEAVLLARYMVARYGAHHVIWILGGDGDYRGPQAERWKTIGRTVFPAGRAHRPVGMHPRGMQSPWAEYQDEEWLDVLLYQSGHGNDARKWRWNATQGMAADWKMEPARPVIDAEINYEAHLDYHTHKPITDYQVRRAAYTSLLAAPPAGVTYGAHGIWFWSRKAEVPLDHPHTGVALPWFECLDYPGAQQMRVLRGVFDAMEWWKLRPDRSLVIEGEPDAEFRSYVMPARSEDGKSALIYLPANPSVTLDLSSFPGKVFGFWIDPRSGRRDAAGRWPPRRGVEVKTPGGGDWLLLLRAD